MARLIGNRDSELSTTKSTTGISDVLGGLASFMLNYFKMKFPENLFNETYISDSLNANILSKGTAHAQSLPYIGMEMEFTDEESIMGQYNRGHFSQQFIANKDRDSYYRKIFEDVDGKVRIYAIPKRLRVTFNYLLKFQTHLAAMDWVHYLNNNFEYNGINYVNGIRLPVELPRYFIDRIRYKYDWDPKNPEHNEALRYYLRDNSLGGIRYVINPSTGNKSYMFEYVTNVMLQYPEQPSMNTEHTNLVVRNSEVSFSIDAEISSPSGFILEVKDGQLTPGFSDRVDGPREYTMNYHIITDKIPNELEDGKRMIDKAEFITEMNKGIDELNVAEILSKDLRQTIEAIAKIEEFDIGKLFKYTLYADTKLVDETQYEVSFHTHKLVNFNPSPNVTYTLVLYGDMRRLNDINELILTGNRHRIKPLLHSYM